MKKEYEKILSPKMPKSFKRSSPYIDFTWIRIKYEKQLAFFVTRTIWKSSAATIEMTARYIFYHPVHKITSSSRCWKVSALVEKKYFLWKKYTG